MYQNQNDHQNQSLSSVPSSPEHINTFQNASGTIPYGMTNDYMFRAVLQSNNKVLRGLVGALLHLSEDKIKSVKITNPIILGESVENKEFRLDINLLLNDYTTINLEMQVANKLNWDKRSVIYLCRSFDSLNHGQDYAEAKPVIHIGFLDYTLFDKFPEFYATYKLLNVKNHQTYSDSLTLSVVNLSCIDLATEEDKRYHIDHWAMLFKATTWEELKMLAAENEYLNEASNTMYLMSADERIRKQCLDREEYYQDLRSYERAIAERDDVIMQKDNIIAQKDDTITQQNNAIAQKDDTIVQQSNTIAQKDDTIARHEAQIKQLNAELEKLKMQLQ